MSDGMRRELVYLSSHATNRYFIPNWGIELKVTKFIPDYVGQLNFYVSAVDELMKQADDNPTIGLLICKSKDNTVVEWSFRGLSRPLGVAEYELNKVVNEVAAKTLPTETELQKLIDTYEV